MLIYCQPRDIVERLLRRKRIWFHGNPYISLSGKQGKMGILRFDFIDEVVEFGIYLKDKDQIQQAARRAVMLFKQYAKEIDAEAMSQ